MRNRMMIQNFVLTFFLVATLFLSTAISTEAAGNPMNIIGTENLDYNLTVKMVSRSKDFKLNNEKISFYLLGCNVISSSADQIEVVIRNTDDGAKLVFIAPEAGRVSGNYNTADFYRYANSILRIKSTDKLIFEKTNNKWQLTIGENDIDANLYLEGKKSWNEKLKYSGSVANPYKINLANYTLNRDGGVFKMYHNFSPSSPLYNVDHTITFDSEEIMFRTFETRLSANSHDTYITVDRELSQVIVGSVIQYTGDSDDGDNLATITRIDKDAQKIYLQQYDSVSNNTHEEGTWLRCFADYGNGQVYDNQYPKVNLEPITWSISEVKFNDLMQESIIRHEPTGLMTDINIDIVDGSDFGYGLKNVTYSYDGLNFTGGLTGVFDIDIDMNFFGRSLTVGPVRIDYATMANGLADQIFRINTYKREAFRFYFNPNIFDTYCDWGVLPNPPDVFPLTFRLYFDKECKLIGGNVKINVPGRGIPLPGGLAVVDNIGGGFTYPATFGVSAIFKDAGLDALGVSFWNADVEAVLSIDRAYLTLDGRVWVWGNKFEVGDASATVAWSYYKGKRFKGIEFSGETGVGTRKVNLVFDLEFKIKRYKSNGMTKSYIGGSGSGRVKAFGATFAGVGIKATTRKFSAYVNPPGPIGNKKVTIYYKNISKAANVSSISDRAVSSITDEYGNLILLMPEAKRIPQPYQNSKGTDDTLNLPDNATQAAITINYQGSIENISVLMPDSTTAEVVISDENTVVEAGKLYALNYELDEAENQLYIQIDNAEAGDYTLSYTTDTVLETALFEITQIPTIDSNGVTAVNTAGVIDLSWNLETVVPGDIKYHLSLQTLEGDTVTGEYQIYENMMVDDDGDDIDNGDETEIFVDDAALTIAGTAVSARVKLPENLVSGSYRFVVEPVLNNIDEDDLEGTAVNSNTITYSNPGYGGIVTTPTDVSVSNTGNGITKIEWDYDPTVYSWDIIIRNMAGDKVGAAAVLSTELALLKNLYIDPLSGDQSVYLNMSLDGNQFSTATVSELQYDTDYTFEVNAVQRIIHAGGDYYNAGLGYIDMNNIESDLNEEYLIYNAVSPKHTGRFIESEGVHFNIEIYENGKTDPIFSANLFEGDTGTIGYDYDFDSELDAETLRQIDPGALVVRTNVMDSIKLLPDNGVRKFGIVIISPSGQELLNIPALTLTSLGTPGNWTTLATEISSNYTALTPENILLLKSIYESGAITLEDTNNIKINLEQLSSSTIIDAMEPGRHTASIRTFNANNDRTDTDFEITIRDTTPAPFIDKIKHIGGHSYNVAGFVNGAASISINGNAVDVTDGSFDFTTDIRSDLIEYKVIDEFGNEYPGSIEYNEYIDQSGGGSSCFILSL